MYPLLTVATRMIVLEGPSSTILSSQSSSSSLMSSSSFLLPRSFISFSSLFTPRFLHVSMIEMIRLTYVADGVGGFFGGLLPFLLSRCLDDGVQAMIGYFIVADSPQGPSRRRWEGNERKKRKRMSFSKRRRSPDSMASSAPSGYTWNDHEDGRMTERAFQESSLPSRGRNQRGYTTTHTYHQYADGHSASEALGGRRGETRRTRGRSNMNQEVYASSKPFLEEKRPESLECEEDRNGEGTTNAGLNAHKGWNRTRSSREGRADFLGHRSDPDPYSPSDYNGKRGNGVSRVSSRSRRGAYGGRGGGHFDSRSSHVPRGGSRSMELREGRIPPRRFDYDGDFDDGGGGQRTRSRADESLHQVELYTMRACFSSNKQQQQQQQRHPLLRLGSRRYMSTIDLSVLLGLRAFPR